MIKKKFCRAAFRGHRATIMQIPASQAMAGLENHLDRPRRLRIDLPLRGKYEKPKFFAPREPAA